MKKQSIEKLSKERTKVLQDIVDEGKRKKSEERVKILREALDKEPEEKTVEIVAEEPKEGEEMPEELKEKLKTPKENATEAEVAMNENISKYKEEGKKREEKLVKAAESAKRLEPKLKKMRAEILFGKKGEAGVVAEIKKNLKDSEAEWDKIGEDLDWLVREEEAKKILGKEGLEKIKQLREESTREVEPSFSDMSPKIEINESAIIGREPVGGWSDAGGAEGGEEIFELNKKKEMAYEVEPKTEKLSLTELDDRVNALWTAMDKILQDAAAYQPTKVDKKAMQVWAKKNGGIEDWPLDDKVTPENYKKRLEKYGVADFIDASKIELHNDAYAVVSKQYKVYREELENRIKKVKLRQLEKLEDEEDAGITKRIVAKKQEKIKAEEVVPLTKKKEKIKQENEEVDVTDDIIEESVNLDNLESEEETLEEKEKKVIERGRKKIIAEGPIEEKNIDTAIIKKPKKKKGFFGWLKGIFNKK